MIPPSAGLKTTNWLIVFNGLGYLDMPTIAYIRETFDKLEAQLSDEEFCLPCIFKSIPDLCSKARTVRRKRNEIVHLDPLAIEPEVLNCLHEVASEFIRINNPEKKKLIN